MRTVKIHIKDDIYTIVDRDIAERLKGKSIFIRSREKKYACIIHKRKITPLHRFIMDAQTGQIVDHINRKKLDNRRCNLRFVTGRGNCLNRSGRTRNRLKYFRIYDQKFSSRFRSRLRINNKMVHLGCYKSKVIAALIADQYVKKYSYVTPRLNFPSSIKRRHLPLVLSRTRGRIFSVVFVRRKDGHERHMVCRINVNKNVKGSGLLFKPENVNLLPVFDVKKKDYRFIPLENVLCLTFRKKRYRIV